MNEKEQGHTRCWISLGATKINDVQMQFINFCLEHIVYSNVLSFLKHDRSIGFQIKLHIMPKDLLYTVRIWK